VKCINCNEKSVIRIKRHNSCFCKNHFNIFFINQIIKNIKKYKMISKSDKVMICVSGGKDSMVLWKVLNDLEYNTVGMYIDLGISGYSDKSKEKVLNFAEKNDLKYKIIDLNSKNIAIETLSKEKNRAECSVCGIIKRYYFNKVAYEIKADIIATGHNLDDEAATLFSNTMQWNGDYLLRQHPVLPAKNGLARKVKPLFRFYEREMAAYTLLRGIEYIYEECPFSVGSTSTEYKELLNQLENRHPGAKQHFFVKFLAAKEKGLFAEATERIVPELHLCPSCGQPTSAAGTCTFCKMMQRAKQSGAR
jgi:uncharacterized protein (TIGR00269 family)